MKTTLTTMAAVFCVWLAATSVSADYQVVSFDKAAGILTLDQNGALKSFRIAAFTDITINGVRASADQLRPGMVVALTLADPQTITRIAARGNPGAAPPPAASGAPKPGLPMPGALPSLAGPMGTRKISLKLRVDGQDTVKIRDGQLWIEHGGWGKPEDITINGVPWKPQWQGKRTENFTGFVPPLAPFGLSNVTVKKYQGRGEVKRTQPPTNANDQTLSVHIDDRNSGSDFYEIRISW